MTTLAYKRKTHLFFPYFFSNFTMAQYYEHYRKSRYIPWTICVADVLERESHKSGEGARVF